MDGLHPWNGLPSVPKYHCKGTKAQYIPLPGLGVPPRRNPEVSLTLPRDAHADPASLAQEYVPIINYFRLPTTCCAQETGMRIRAQLLYLRGDL